MKGPSSTLWYLQIVVPCGICILHTNGFPTAANAQGRISRQAEIHEVIIEVVFSQLEN